MNESEIEIWGKKKESVERKIEILNTLNTNSLVTCLDVLFCQARLKKKEIIRLVTMKKEIFNANKHKKIVIPLEQHNNKALPLQEQQTPNTEASSGVDSAQHW